MFTQSRVDDRCGSAIQRYLNPCYTSHVGLAPGFGRRRVDVGIFDLFEVTVVLLGSQIESVTIIDELTIFDTPMGPDVV